MIPERVIPTNLKACVENYTCECSMHPWSAKTFVTNDTDNPKTGEKREKISSSLAFSLLPSKKVTAQLNLLSGSYVCDVMIRECVRMCKHPPAHYLDNGAFLLRLIVTIALLRRVTFSHGHVSRKDSLHDASFFFFIQELASSSSSFLLRSATIRQPLLNSQWRWCRYAIRLSSSFFIAAAITMPLQNYLLLVGWSAL